MLEEIKIENLIYEIRGKQVMLDSDVARLYGYETKISKKIINAFVVMRHFINDNKDIFRRLTTVEYEMIECKDKIDELFDKLEPKKLESQKIFFGGEIYDAYSLIIDLIKEAKEKIIIIDNYIDKSILDMLVYKKENVSIELVTSSHYLTKTDINKFNKQYPNLNIKYSNIFHDRFIIIDSCLYHLGASLKDLGKKCFAINKIEDKAYLERIIKSIN